MVKGWPQLVDMESNGDRISGVTIDMVDFKFEISPPISLESPTAQRLDTLGPTTFQINNKGQQDYEAFLVKLAPGPLPPTL